MKRPVTSRLHARANRGLEPRGYTMIEILIATALMLVIMLAVAWVFGMVGESISDSRSTMRMSGELRIAVARLSRDLKGLTVSSMGNAWKPRDPGADEGYFEYTEGPIGPLVLASNVAVNSDRPIPPPNPPYFEPDSTAGDIDDMLMFTTRDIDESFIGQVAMKRDPTAGETPDGWDLVAPNEPYVYKYGTIQAEAAEVAWFVRGTTLYRKQLLVFPQFPDLPQEYNPAGVLVRKFNMDQRASHEPGTESLDVLYPAGFYNNDVSIRWEQRLDPSTGTWVWRMAANTLGDLTKPENRFAHQVRRGGNPPAFPFHPHFQMNWTTAQPSLRLEYTQWATPASAGTPVPGLADADLPGLGLPTLQECSHPEWPAGGVPPNLDAGGPWSKPEVFDAWLNPHAWDKLDRDTGTMDITQSSISGHPPLYMGSRVGEDVILTNVISFDVKAWDPTAPVLPGVNAMGTPSNLADDVIFDVEPAGAPDGVPDIAVAPGDPGYWLALRHLQNLPPSNWPPNFSVLSYGAYVDLNYSAIASNQPDLSDFAGPGQAWTPLMFLDPNFPSVPRSPHPNSLSHTPRVYDTWSNHYENNWVDMIQPPNGSPDPGEPGDEDRDNLFDEGANGIDDPGNGLDDDNNGYFDEPGETAQNGAVDDVIEQEAPAPYPVPLRGIQIRIRVFDPDSHQIREMTIVQDFLTK